MKKIVFNDYEDLSKYMCSKAENSINITATLFFDDAIALIKRLLLNDEVEVGGINIAQTEYNGYSKEYYITLSDDMILDVVPAHNGKVYLNAEPDIMLIHGNASSSIIKDIDDDTCIEIYVGSEDDCDEYTDNDEVWDFILENTKIVKNENGKPIGLSVDISSLLKFVFD